MAKKRFVHCEECFGVFHNRFCIRTIETLSFHIHRVIIIVSMECDRTRNDFFCENSWKNNLKLKKDYAEKFNKATGIAIQIRHWDGYRRLSIERIDVVYFPNSVHPDRNETGSEFN